MFKNAISQIAHSKEIFKKLLCRYLVGVKIITVIVHAFSQTLFPIDYRVSDKKWFSFMNININVITVEEFLSLIGEIQ